MLAQQVGQLGLGKLVSQLGLEVGWLVGQLVGQVGRVVGQSVGQVGKVVGQLAGQLGQQQDSWSVSSQIGLGRLVTWAKVTSVLVVGWLGQH